MKQKQKGRTMNSYQGVISPSIHPFVEAEVEVEVKDFYQKQKQKQKYVVETERSYNKLLPGGHPSLYPPFCRSRSISRSRSMQQKQKGRTINSYQGVIPPPIHPFIIVHAPLFQGKYLIFCSTLDTAKKEAQWVNLGSRVLICLQVTQFLTFG